METVNILYQKINKVSQDHSTVYCVVSTNHSALMLSKYTVYVLYPQIMKYHNITMYQQINKVS